MAEKVLKLYKKSGNTIKRFPDVEVGQLPLVVTDFTYDAKRMGGAPTIQCTIMYHKCLDDEWTKDVYTEFRGEKYYIKQTPSSTKDNKDARWKHEVTLISERSVLDNIYFFDVVDSKEGLSGHAPVSNSTDFTFFGTIEEFVKRLNESMVYAGVGKSEENADGYSVEINRNSLSVDDLSLAKAVSFQDKFISEALQEIFNAYGFYYYFKGKTIYVGDDENAIIASEAEPLEYGATKALISVQKSNANYKPINNICGRGSDKNIPYYYPNPSNEGICGFKLNNEISDKITIDSQEQELFYIKKDYWDEISVSNDVPSEYTLRGEAMFFSNNKLTTEQKNEPYNLTHDPDLVRGNVIDISDYFKRYSVNYSSYYSYVGCSIVLYFNFADTKYGRRLKALSINKNNIEISLSYVGGPYATDIQNIECSLFKHDGHEYSNIRKDSNGYFNVPDMGEYNMYITFDIIQTIPNSSELPTTYTFKCTNTDNPDLYVLGINIYNKGKLTEKIQAEASQPLSSYGIILAPNIGLKLGDKITRYTIQYLLPLKNLQADVYIKSLSNARFYPARNYPIKRGTRVPNENIGEYTDDSTGYIENHNYKNKDGEYYKFENPYSANNQYQHIVDFPDIMPTIEGVENGEELRIDMFSEFEYDTDDNNFEKEYKGEDKDSSGTLKREHPYFFGKLRKMPFNLFDHAIEGGEMTIAMTSGNLGSCKFVIHVGEEHQKNVVQVNNDGTLKRDTYGNVLCGREVYVKGQGWKSQTPQNPQSKQNDTRTNEVWVALAKDTETFTTVMPYAQDGVLTGYRPKASEKDEDENDLNNGDTFVLLNIKLPQAYIDAAQVKLTKETIKYLAENNKEKFSFAIDFSRIYLAENPSVLDSLSENSMVYIKHNNNTYKQYISSYSYKMSRKDALPEIKVNLSETLSAQTGALQQVINEVKSQVEYSIGRSSGMGVSLATLDRQYIRRDTQDTTTGNITFLNGTKYGKNKEDGKSSAEMQIDAENNSTLTVDNLNVRNTPEYVRGLEERLLFLENKFKELTQ